MCSVRKLSISYFIKKYITTKKKRSNFDSDSSDVSKRKEFL
jgi:hypothetical protein